MHKYTKDLQGTYNHLHLISFRKKHRILKQKLIFKKGRQEKGNIHGMSSLYGNRNGKLENGYQFMLVGLCQHQTTCVFNGISFYLNEQVIQLKVLLYPSLPSIPCLKSHFITKILTQLVFFLVSLYTVLLLSFYFL